MTHNYYVQGAAEPTLFITKNKQRVKQYDGNIVYLKDGDEFELELFNPKSNKVLAKIQVNGNYLNSGIVLRPGERVFLERYLDEARKFKFETYHVDDSIPNVREAIKNNGVVEVKFFNEIINPPIITNRWYGPYYYYEPSWTYSSSKSSDITYTYCSTTDMNGVSVTAAPQTVETGRVERGDYSDQSFNMDYSSFHSWCCNSITWKILPESTRPYVREDLLIYCVNCGAKRKKSSYKFCPNCGTKF